MQAGVHCPSYAGMNPPVAGLCEGPLAAEKNSDGVCDKSSLSSGTEAFPYLIVTTAISLCTVQTSVLAVLTAGEIEHKYFETMKKRRWEWMNANRKDSPRHRHPQPPSLSLHMHTQLDKQVKFHIHGNKKEFVVNLFALSFKTSVPSGCVLRPSRERLLCFFVPRRFLASQLVLDLCKMWNII